MKNLFLKNTKLWISVLLFVFFIFYTSFINFSISKKYYQTKIQKVVNTIEVEFNKYSDKNNRLINERSPLIHDNNFIFLEYSNDSLVFWNTNKFPQFNISNENLNKVSIDYNSFGIFIKKIFSYKKSKTVCLYKIKDNYSLENEYLENDFVDKLAVPKGIEISKIKSQFPITNGEGQPIAHLIFNKTAPTDANVIIMYFTLLLAFIYFIAFLICIFRENKVSAKIQRIIIYSSIIAFYLVTIYSDYLSFLRESAVFLPSSFAFTQALTSIGSLLTALWMLFILIMSELQISKLENKLKTKFNNFYPYLAVFLESILFISLINIIRISVTNTSPDIDLTNITTLGIVGLFGLVSLLVLALNFVIISNVIFDKIDTFDYKHKYIILIFFILNLAFVYLVLGEGNQRFINILLLIFIYGLYFLKISSKILSQASKFILIVVIVSFIINYNLVEINKQKEQSRRESLIQTLAINQDPEAEYLFSKIESKIYKDSVLIRIIREQKVSSSEITDYILKNYFGQNKHWLKYDFQITLCDQRTNLLIKPKNQEINCSDFFYQSLISLGTITSNNNLYRMEYGTGQINYLGLLRFKTIRGINYTFYIEINSKIKRKGFTKLLSPSGLDPFEKLRNYSLAKYVNDTLSEYYGNYSYKYIIEDSINVDDLKFVNQEGENHLFYKLNNKETFILSKSNASLLSQIAPFTYLLVLILVLALSLLVQFNKAFNLWEIPQSFSFRLQISFIVLIGISIILITWISIIYVKGLNSDKDLKTIKSTAISLQTEFEHKLVNTLDENTNLHDYLNELSSKFSKVFGADINLYSLDGELITTTRPELFSFNLLSNKISPEALLLLGKKKEIYIVQEENIGKLEYFSAYMPFHDANNKVVAYLNIPYFAQQDQLRQEVSSLIMTLINAYTFIIVFSILAIILLSSYIIRPLKMIKEKMKKIRVGQQNDYILWNKKDEIGDLIEQYNKMIDKLAVSADLLAKSERESAWQQMAQQVAHEIKNPLTPMKLSLQYLMKAIDDGATDWEERLRKLSNTLIEQIDTLADIATAFSDFAKMPTNHLETFDLKEALDASIKIFQDIENVEIIVDVSQQKCLVNADKNQMIRVFNNLIKNAIQSYSFNQKAKIEIKIVSESESWKTIIKDNGAGISKKEIDKIFIPNFTTKSGGMGLGLAMVKNIITNNDGKIEFETELGKGTAFFVYLKKVDYE